MITHTIDTYWSPSQSKTKSSQSYKLKEFAEMSFLILIKTLHETHLFFFLGGGGGGGYNNQKQQMPSVHIGRFTEENQVNKHDRYNIKIYDVITNSMPFH